MTGAYSSRTRNVKKASKVKTEKQKTYCSVSLEGMHDPEEPDRQDAFTEPLDGWSARSSGMKEMGQITW